MPAYEEGVNGTIFRAVSATSGFRILNDAIHNHPKRRIKAERNLIQGGIAPKPPERFVPAWIRCGQSESELSQGWFVPCFVLSLARQHLSPRKHLQGTQVAAMG
jgi:hypothetical protein